jgi:ABC-type sulfate transport system permease component
VVVLAYNPRVVSVLSYERLTTGGLQHDALPVAAVLVLVSLLPLVLLRLLQYERGAEVVR